MAVRRELRRAGPSARRIVAAETNEIFEEAMGLPHSDLGAGPANKRLRLELDPAAGREDSLVEIVDGRVASYLQVLRREMRIGRALVRVAGMASLATDAAQGGRGNVGALVDEAVAIMARRGFPMAMLFTDRHDLFSAKGWSPLSVECFVARLEGAPGAAPPEGVRRIDASSDLAAVAAIHGHYGLAYAGPLIRSLGWWGGNVKWMPESPESFVVLERDGRAAGYARARYPAAVLGDGSGECYSISDLAALDGEGERALLRWLVWDARNRGFGVFCGQSPPGGEGIGALRELGVMAEPQVDRRMMLKLVSLRALFSALRPEFTGALTRHAGEVAGRIAISVGGDSAALTVDDRDVKVGTAAGSKALRLREEEFWNLILRGELPRSAGVKQRTLLGALFPPRRFAFWRADAF